MPPRPVVVATHGHCFDGTASAVMFTHLLKSIDGEGRVFVYRGQAYDPGKNGVDPSVFVGATDAAILDFRYTVTDRLTWYFDHHVSAFPTQAERDHYAKLEEKGHAFYDAKAGSCTILIDRIAREKFGVDTSKFAELVRWADMIDTAGFPTPQMAVDRSEPEMKLLAVIEQHGDDRLISDLVIRLLDRPLSEVAKDTDLIGRYEPIQALHDAQVQRIRAREKRMGSVVWVDLLDVLTETVTKFVTYADVPDSPYSVVASRTEKRCKISVGYNPWCGIPRAHDIAKICERFGGGGHPVVGAIALPPDPDKCREIALGIIEELNR
ncbi:MAG: DHH family phosphoesterase [Polyangiales bacterium]